MFWVAMVILAIVLSSFYIKYVQKKVAGTSVERTKGDLQTDSLQEIFNKIPEIRIPKIEMPEINQEALQELQRMMEEMPQEITEETEEMPIENNHNETTE